MKKKKLWSLLLCLVLVFCMTACGDKEATSGKNDEDDSSKKDDNKVVVDELKPEDMVSGQFSSLSDQITEILEQVQTVDGSSEKQGMDITLDVKPGAALLEGYGISGIEKIGIALGMDVKGMLEMHMSGDLLLNGNKIINLDMIFDKDKVLGNLPEYCDTYFGVSLEDASGSLDGGFNEQFTQMTEGMPSTEEILTIWKKYSEDFIDCFKHKETVEKATVGFGDYAIEAEKYVTVAQMDDLKVVLEALMKELEQYPALGVSYEELDTDVKEVTFSYYSNENGEFAWELEMEQDDEKMSIVFVSSKYGFRFFNAVDGEEDVVLLYSVKESDKKGKIVLVVDGEEFTINYDNFSKEHVDLSAEVEGMAFTLSIDGTDKDFSVSFTLNGNGIEADGKISGTDKKGVVEVNVKYQGIDIGSVTLEFVERDFQSYSVPDTFVDPEVWAESVDQTKLMEKLQQLMTEYPFLMDLMMNLQ